MYDNSLMASLLNEAPFRIRRKTMKLKNMLMLSVLVAGVTFSGVDAHASLTPFASFNGHVAMSTDGFGSTSNSGIISASVPAGSTVLGAYLYASTFNSSAPGATLNGSAVSYGPNLSSIFLGSYRADVTSIVKSVIEGGPGGITDFAIVETVNGGGTDGEALVVVYENAALPEASVGILDGFTSSGGDRTAINFADPLDPTAPGFFAEMRLGIGFSVLNQRSNVSVNGSLLTSNAGNNDDGVGSISNGQLITVGGFDDPFSPTSPSYADDHERYNLSSFVSLGDTSITVDTNNPSGDDNIFLAAFYVSGNAGFNAPPPPTTPPPPPTTDPVPEPASVILMGTGLFGLWYMKRAKK